MDPLAFLLGPRGGSESLARIRGKQDPRDLGTQAQCPGNTEIAEIQAPRSPGTRPSDSGTQDLWHPRTKEKRNQGTRELSPQGTHKPLKPVIEGRRSPGDQETLGRIIAWAQGPGSSRQQECRNAGTRSRGLGAQDLCAQKLEGKRDGTEDPRNPKTQRPSNPGTGEISDPGT